MKDNKPPITKPQPMIVKPTPPIQTASGGGPKRPPNG